MNTPILPVNSVNSGPTPSLQSDSTLPSLQSPSATDDYYMDLFMPQRTGRRSPWALRQVARLLGTLLLAVCSCGLAAMGGVCFASGVVDAGDNAAPDACYFYLTPLKKFFIHLRVAGDRHHWGRLLNSWIWVASIVTALFSVRSLLERVLRWRRTTRLRSRVVTAMAGSSSRNDVTRRLMRGLRSVVEVRRTEKKQLRPCPRPRLRPPPLATDARARPSRRSSCTTRR